MQVRVLHVINRLSGSGAETSLRESLLARDESDLTHAVVVLGPDNNRLDGLTEAGVRVFMPSRPLPRRLQRVVYVRRVMLSWRPDLLHTTLFEADTAGRVAATLTGTPVLTSLVNTPYVPAASSAVSGRMAAQKLLAVKLVDGILARHATTAFHAITQAAADAAVADLRVDPAKVYVIPRGRDLARLGMPSEERRKTMRTQLGVPEDAPVLLSIGRQEAQKGQVHLVDALPRVLQRRPDTLVLLAGREGNASAALRARIQGHGLESSVRLLGFRPDVGDLLAATDVFVFPSLYEGLGGVLLEAMAMKVPIVASDVPAIREVLDEGRCGDLVAPADAESLAGAVLEVLDTPDRIRDQVQAARARLEKTYDLATNLRAMRELYRRLGGVTI